MLGWALLEANNPGRAVGEFGKVLAIDPHNASAANGLLKLGVQS